MLKHNFTMSYTIYLNILNVQYFLIIQECNKCDFVMKSKTFIILKSTVYNLKLVISFNFSAYFNCTKI